ncbi:MAG: hypothetical protein HY526_05555 [Betaproteobacteria bacterium]|nr:hypothetical protein [Betaproteobacteria bacterium]
MDADEIAGALAIDPAWERAARGGWLALMDLAVWADLRSSRMGATARLRKRVFEVGERLKSVVARPDWIPHPRERLKNALASALHLRRCLEDVFSAAQALDAGADRDAFGARLGDLMRVVEGLAPLEKRWAELLDAQYREDGD